MAAARGRVLAGLLFLAGCGGEELPRQDVALLQALRAPESLVETRGILHLPAAAGCGRVRRGPANVLRAELALPDPSAGGHTLHLVGSNNTGKPVRAEVRLDGEPVGELVLAAGFTAPALPLPAGGSGGRATVELTFSVPWIARFAGHPVNDLAGAVALRYLAVLPAGTEPAPLLEQVDGAPDALLPSGWSRAVPVGLLRDGVLRLSAEGTEGARLTVRWWDAGAGEDLLERTFALDGPRDVALELSRSDAERSWLAIRAGDGDVRLGAAALEATRERPNVVLIVVDTLRADAVVDDDGNSPLPGIGRLARDGVVFTRCFSHASLTLPSHASLFSSRPPHEHGVANNAANPVDGLPLVAEALGRAGYTTGSVVSIASLRDVRHVRLARGFDVRFPCDWNIAWADDAALRTERLLACVGTARPLFLFVHLADPHEPYRPHDGGAGAEADLSWNGTPLGRWPLSTPERFQRNLPLSPGANRFAVEADVPFVVYDLRCRVDGELVPVAFEEGGRREPARRAVVRIDNATGAARAAQLDVWAFDRLDADEARARYAREVEYTDAHVESLLAELDRRGLYDSSLIVFTSDHGEALGDHDLIGHGRNLFDELLHVPLIVKPPRGHPWGPGEGAGPRVDARFVRHVDVVPTLLELLELPALPGQRGVSLLGSDADGERVLVAETHSAGRYLCLRDERFKLVLHAETGAFTMYDLAEDPGETADVFARCSGLRPGWPDRLRAHLEESLGHAPAPVDAARRRELEALGYVDD